MKKLLLAVAAFGMLFTSCAKDDFAEQTDATVTFTVNAPSVATRYGDGKEATKLYWAVYDENGRVEALNGEKAINLTTNVDLKLIQGRSYNVLFWAAAEGAPYTIDWDAKTMEVNYQALSANQESYDAFFKYEPLGKVNGAVAKEVELTRPFAQLNIATADTNAATAAELAVEKTAVKVTNIFSTLNLATGAVDNEVEATFALANRAEGTITVDNVAYDQIAMNYLLVGAKKLVGVELTINDEGLTRSYSSVPVQRNYRTNIIGNILTSAADFTVTILPGFEDDAEGVEPHPNGSEADKLTMAAQMGGEFTLTEDVVLTTPIIIPEGVVFELDLNGHSITVESGNAIKNNGTLILTGDDVITRTTEEAVISSGTTYGIYNNGTLSIDGAKVNGIYNAGKLTIESGAFKNIYRDKHVIYNYNAELTINGGVFHNENAGNATIYMGGTTVATINNGTFSINDGRSTFGWTSCLLDSKDDAQLTINNGTFNGGLRNYGTKAIEVNGGTFNNDVGGDYNVNSAVVKGGVYANTAKAFATKWIAEGYKMMQSGELYFVVEDKFDAVVTDSSSIQSVLAEGKKTILLAAGNYDLGGVMNISGYDAAIIGSSPEEVTISGAMTMDSSSKNFTVENVTFKWDGNYQSNGVQTPIQLKNTKGLVKFKNCVFSNADNKTFGNNNFGFIHATSGVEQLVVEGCTFNKCAPRFAIFGQIGTSATATSKIINNKFIGGTYNGGGFGIEGPMTIQNVEIKGNEITGYFRLVASDDSYALKNIVIEDNTLSQNLALATTTNVENVTFKNNKKTNGTVWASPNAKFITE